MKFAPGQIDKSTKYVSKNLSLNSSRPFSNPSQLGLFKNSLNK